jgi:hypothetical protein
MMLLFGPMGLAVGRLLRHRVFSSWDETASEVSKVKSSYALPIYLTGYIAAIVGTLLVAHIPTLLALALLFDALLLILSARVFREPLWLYAAAVLPILSLLIALPQGGIIGNRQGWWLIGLGAVYLSLASLLRRVKLSPHSTAPLTLGFALVALGLPPSSQDQIGALWGYGSAAVIYAISAFWLCQPLLLIPSSALSIVPYAISLARSPIDPEFYGLALYPGVLIALTLAWALDTRLGRWRDFPWDTPSRWPAATAERLFNWWGLPLYALGFGMAAVSPFFTRSRSDFTALNIALLFPLCCWAIHRFRRRGWLLAAAVTVQLSAGFVLDALGWWHLPSSAWLRFLPVTVLTTLVAVFIERCRAEGSPLALRRLITGWSRPLYMLVLLDILLAQLSCLRDVWPAATVTQAHALLIGLLATLWLSPRLTYLSAGLGAAALLHWLVVLAVPITTRPAAFAYLALAYGLLGYGITFLRDRVKVGNMPLAWVGCWEFPLRNTGLVISCLTIFGASNLGGGLLYPAMRALFGLPFGHMVDLPTVRMIIAVLSSLGLLYVTAAVVHRRLWLGYLATGMLLTGWMLYALFIRGWGDLARLQWYATPTVIYLIGISYLEFRNDRRLFARRLDYLAVLLLIGSLLIQVLLLGWRFALLMAVEGLLLLWWGNARRLRRFFYAGMLAVILATVGQLINSLQSVNQWIAFGIIGLSLILAGIIAERKFEDIKASLEKVLDTWE